MQRSHIVGTLCAVGSAACFALIPLCSHIVYEGGMSPRSVLLFRFALAALCLGALAIARQERVAEKKNSGQLAILGVFGFALQAFLFFSSLALISGSLATVLLYLYPAFVVLLLFAKGRHIGKGKFLALGITLAGCYLAMNPAIELEGREAIMGILLAVGAAIVNAIYVVGGEKILKQERPILSVATMSATAAGIFLASAILQGIETPSTLEGWCALLCIGVVSTAGAIGLQFQGIKLIGSVRASMLATLEPVMTLIIEIAILSGALTFANLTGILLILSANVIILKPET